MTFDDFLIEHLGIDSVNTTDMMRYAFLKGAKYWQYQTNNETMWQSDQDRVWKEACRLYPKETEICEEVCPECGPNIGHIAGKDKS